MDRLKQLAACLVLLILILLGLYSLFGAYLIEQIYFERLSAALNNILSGRSEHSLEFYLDAGDLFVFRWTLRGLILSMLLFAVAGNRWRKKLGLILFNIILVFGLLEGTFLFGLHNAAFARRLGFYPLLFSLNSNFGWSVIQFEPDCAQYDKAFSYLLRPGSCRIASHEFETVLNVNSKGLPDDEVSLNKPEIIVLGDSFSMGWGVRPEQTFASVLEKESGLKVLNAGISSFGTVRELGLFHSLDTRALKVLVIQYYKNDHIENREFYRQDSIEVMSKESYQAQVADYLGNQGYWPLRYSVSGLIALEEKLLRLFIGRNEQALVAKKLNSAELFLHILKESKVLERKDLKILVFDPSFDGDFTELLAKELASDKSLADIELLDFKGILEQEDYYDYDPHLRPSGHRKIAEVLGVEINSFDLNQ